MDSTSVNRDRAVAKIMNMPEEQVRKVLIFMAGMEAGAAQQNTGRPKKAGAG